MNDNNNSLTQRIRMLVFDVDGTLTDGKIYMGSQGETVKAFNIKDGYGIRDIMPKYSIMPVVITGRDSAITKNRCDELGIIDVYQGVNNKVEQLKSVLYENRIKISQVAYIGDDLNDLLCMNLVLDGGGLVGCPADAANEVKAISSFISQYNGGNGAVREFIEWLTTFIEESKLN